MRHEPRSDGAGDGRPALEDRIADLAEEISESKRRVLQLENTLRAVVNHTEGISIGGPCKCGESFLIVREKQMYCPQCSYRQTI